LLGPLAAGQSQPSAQTARLKYGPPRELCKLADRAINESSGLAASPRYKGVFWTHNDSGGKPTIFAFNEKGVALATVTVSGAKARDWEDMAAFTYKRRSFLIIGDVGDNFSKRNSYTLYVLAEPMMRPDRKGQKLTARLLQTLEYVYTDGKHNCESISIDPTTRTIYTVSKVGGRECKVYAMPWPGRSGVSRLKAKPIATLKISTTTAMDISPDGLRAIVLTYGDAYEYVRGPKETWVQGFAREARQIKMPRRTQGESICFGLDGKAMYLTSECANKNSANPSPLFEVPVVE